MSAFVIQVGILLITMGRVFATLRLDSSYNQMNVYVMRRPTSLRRMGNVFVMLASIS